jgi:hypothetical protein
MSEMNETDTPICPLVEQGVQAARYASLNRSILAPLAVLPHEDRETFQLVLEALLVEYRPQSMTERHLVEELAAIMWRKRRVLQAEGARINEGLRDAVNRPKLVVAAAAPFQRGLTGEAADLPDLLTASPEDLAERQREAHQDLARTRKAARILERGGATAYNRARQALSIESRAWWDEYAGEGDYPGNAEGLVKFITDLLEPACWRQVQEVRFTPEIKAQTLGEGLQMGRLEKLARYETHLDRKLERMLAMLVKLQAMRPR